MGPIIAEPPTKKRGTPTSATFPVYIIESLSQVQKEDAKSKEEVGESSKQGSPFAPEIRDKPIPTSFRLLALESYDGSSDPTEHVVAF
ncbi:hypothetical protein B296_00054692 [Ensete ventricosum]|uniref:Uncharacterized protein n=1 Tax=Ensete ventricosum TaxID=4639 RepID=A0A426XQD2_ENSVE|nr:hypothetical protein B296_00054692 [Ensete ventricosum]